MADSKRIESYIRKVVADACATQNRSANEVEWQYMLIENDLLFVIKCPYEKVVRTVAYRLHKNMERNCRVKFHFVNNNAMRVCYDAWNAAEYRLLLEDIDPNYSIAEWVVFGKKYTVEAFEKFDIGDQSAPEHLAKLKEAGYDYTDDSASWETFEAAYKAVYGKTPMGRYLENLKK